MHLTVNGQDVRVGPAGHETLLDLLRDTLGLTGTKRVCDRGECGACTVLLDGEPVYSCLTLANGCEGRSVTTIEGIDGVGQALQAAFVREDAAQCGFCTPGQLMAAAALLASDPSPSDDDIRAAMSGNLCRCGTYPKILRAIRSVADGHA
ncbi:MAG TPA: (2Fe-2S)-binding protein [Gemmatimonadaceae bacterium]|nr:(2Fe-2S)-binding protein [Gemmatimonadaceae bacterium]